VVERYCKVTIGYNPRFELHGTELHSFLSADPEAKATHSWRLDLAGCGAVANEREDEGEGEGEAAYGLRLDCPGAPGGCHRFRCPDAAARQRWAKALGAAVAAARRQARLDEGGAATAPRPAPLCAVDGR
jgi:hypothetical protein